MRGKGSAAIESVLVETERDHVRDRILRAQFWLPTASPRVADVIALADVRAARAAGSR